jgi:CRP-like cAMP-binding protein
MWGLPVYLSAEGVSTEESIIQIPGEALCLSASTFRELLPRLPVLDRALREYSLAYLSHVALTAGCNRAHTIERRCSRWLLLSQDQVEDNTLPLTHEFLGYMLGANRPGVSQAMSTLKAAGYITYARGTVTILDRAGLKRTACADYERTRRVHERLKAALSTV